MNLRTYEILAKWIGRTHGVTISFQPDVTPRANLNTNEIIMPNNLKAEAGYAALSTLAHEAAHLRYSKELPKDLATDKLRHGILNVIEDIRIDLKNFQWVPNMKQIYEKGMEFEIQQRTKAVIKNIPFHDKVLINTIYSLEKLHKGKIRDSQVEKFRKQHRIDVIVEDAVNNLNYGCWDIVKERIEELIKLFNLKPNDVQPQGQKQLKKGLFEGKHDGNKCGNSILGEVVMREATKQKFMELLNIKEKEIIKNGVQLNTDNLTAFLTGDLEELFVQENTENVKKSKILVLLDASGSMGNVLLDRKLRYEVVTNCTKSLVNVLQEVQEMEGLNVDYDIASFDTTYTRLPKENWENHYRIGGDTCIVDALIHAMNDINTASDIDGNKMIIIFTDGAVRPKTIETMKHTLTQAGDIRCMIIGIGAAVTGEFVTQIVGDNNIIASESSEEILMESIMTMLGGD